MSVHDALLQEQLRVAASHFELLNRHHAESCGLLKGSSQPLKLQMVGAKPPKETPQQRPYVLFECALAMSHFLACVRPSQQQLCATAIMLFQQRHCAPEIVMSVRRRRRRRTRRRRRRSEGLIYCFTLHLLWRSLWPLSGLLSNSFAQPPSCRFTSVTARPTSS